MTNGNSMIEFIESMNGTLEEAFIKKYQEEFDRFVEDEYNNRGIE